MALDDPNITKIHFEDFGQMKEITVGPGTTARLACIKQKRNSKWHVDIIDCAAGIFTIECKKDPKKEIMFEVICRKSYLKKNRGGHIAGRYN